MREGKYETTAECSRTDLWIGTLVVDCVVGERHAGFVQDDYGSLDLHALPSHGALLELL